MSSDSDLLNRHGIWTYVKTKTNFQPEESPL